MKTALSLLFALCICSLSFAQSPSYKEDVTKAAEVIRKEAGKYGYSYVISYDNVEDASMFVLPNKSYGIYFVYDKPSVPPVFLAHLMTDDKELLKKYTAKPYDIGVVGAARVSRLTFTTKKFDAEKLPVKIEAHPNATIYIYQK